MAINYDSINRALAVHGTSVTLRHYSGTTPQFDADQNPLNDYVDYSETALVLEPSKSDLFYSGGLLTNNDKKLVFGTGAGGTVEPSDDILIAGGTFRALEVQSKITRTIVFVREEQNT